MTTAPGSERKHFIVISLGTAGDIYPFLNIALALQQRGNGVTFFCPSIHAHYAKAVGLVTCGLGTEEQYLSVIDNPDLWRSHRGIRLVLQSVNDGIESLLATLSALPKGPEFIVLAHPLALATASMARSMGLINKIVGAYLAPANLRTVHDLATIGPLRIPAWMPKKLRSWLWKGINNYLIDPAALPGLNAARTAHGLPCITSFIDHMYGVPDLSLTLFPTWFAKPQPDWPQPMVDGAFQLYDPTPNKALSTELQRFLADGDAPIVFTPGTGNRHAAEYFSIAMEICTKLSKRAIFLTAFRDQVPQVLHETIIWQSYIPFSTLLPRVAAIVHHGGIGTVAEALRAGVPQLVIPLAHDQFDNGVRVQSLGAGDVLITTRLRFNALFTKLQALLSSNEIAKRCQFMATLFIQNENIDKLCMAVESV